MRQEPIPLNTNQNKSNLRNESNLCIDEWMNHNELYAAVEAGLNNEKDLAPITILCCETIQGQYCNRPLIVLMDGGSSGTLLNRRCLPLGACPSRSEQRQITTTASGSFDTSLSVNLRMSNFPSSATEEDWITYQVEYLIHQHVNTTSS